MTAFVYFRQFNGAQIQDPFHRDSKWLKGVKIGSRWPGGYYAFSAAVHRDVLREVLYGGGDEVVVRDGETILYQGRLDDPELSSMGNEAVNIAGVGWLASLKDRRLRYRWIDANGVLRLEWPMNPALYNLQAQEKSVIEKRNDMFVYRAAPDDYDMSGLTPNTHWEEYINPVNNPIKRVTFTYKKETGEQIAFYMYDGDGTLQWSDVAGGSVGPANVDVTFSPGTSNIFRLVFDPAEDTMDQNDLVRIYNLKIYGDTAFTQGAMVERVLDLAGDFISTDYSKIAEPGLTLQPFLTRNDGFQTALSLIQDIIAYGDATFDLYGFQVWDGSDSADGLPQAELVERSTTDYEYVIDPNRPGVQFSLSPQSRDKLFNWVAIRYVDSRSSVRYLTPYDNALLKDADSIAGYGQRDIDLDIGPADEALALAIGRSFLAQNKDPQTKARFGLTGTVPTKNGREVGVGRIKAGERVKFKPTGEIFFLRDVSYGLDTQRASLSTDLAPDQLSRYLKQRNFGLEVNWPLQSGYLGG